MILFPNDSKYISADFGIWDRFPSTVHSLNTVLAHKNNILRHDILVIHEKVIPMSMTSSLLLKDQRDLV